MTERLTKEQIAQAADYEFPYHHLIDANVGAGNFKSYKNLSFALPYMVTARLILSVLKDTASKSWCDIGCGDGGMFALLGGDTVKIDKKGIDFDYRSIELASLLNDASCSFQCVDILDKSYNAARFELVTLIEVFEHIIPPTIAEGFLASVGEHVANGGSLVITVPHKNQRKPVKHFRHFDIAEMTSICRKVLPNFEIHQAYGFNVKNLLERFVKGVLCTKHLFLETPGLNRKRFNRQINAIPVNEKHCQQIFLQLTKKS